VFWSIGSRQKSEKLVGSGCWVQVYTNGDVYEGEFHKGKCSGSGVYYYYMSGRYGGIGSMGSMMGMGWRLGQEEVDIEGNTGKGLGMGLECIGSILEMFTLGNGQMGRVMVAGFIRAMMVAGLLGSSSGASSMGWVTTISGMGTFMLENTLQTRCMVLEYIVSQVAIGMKELGMREKGKGLECTLSEVGRPNLGIGIMGFLMSQAHRTPRILYLLLQCIIPEY